MKWFATFAAGIVAVTSLAALAEANAASTRNPCATSQVRLAIGPLVSEKTEQHTATVTLTNVASTPCELDGYPRIELFDSRGRMLHFIYEDRGDQMITGAGPRLVRLQSGGSAFLAFNKTACDAFTDRYARTLRVTLPENRAGRTIRLRRYPVIDFCSGSSVFVTVTVSPVEPTREAVFCASQRSCRRG